MMYCYAQPDGGQRQVPDNYMPLATEIVSTQPMPFDDVMAALQNPAAFNAAPKNAAIDKQIADIERQTMWPRPLRDYVLSIPNHPATDKATAVNTQISALRAQKYNPTQT